MQAAFVRVPYVDPLYRKYHKGRPVTVYYDPLQPERSVIEPGAPALGGAILYYGLRRETPKRR